MSSGGGSFQSSGGGQHDNITHSPSYSQSSRGSQNSTSRQLGTTTSPNHAYSGGSRPSMNMQHGVLGGTQAHSSVRSGNSNPSDTALRGHTGAGMHSQHLGISHSNIGNRSFTGNAVNFSNHNSNLGHNSSQSGYSRHSGYGNWNGNRGDSNNLSFGLGSGRGFSRGYYSGYNGYGWGLGNGYGGCGGYGGYGGYGAFRYRPLCWGLGSMYYNSGYLGYSNPYCVNVGSTSYNYSQPIPVVYNAPTVVATNSTDSSDVALNNAVAAFQQNNYDASLDIINQGVTQHPDDAVLHEFRALVLFAKRDYQQAAATMHSVLAVGPGWDWTTLIHFYANADLYTTQLRALEAFRKANPQDAASHFLLAYHYITCGHTDEAASQLQTVVQLMPNDSVASELLKMVSSPLPTQADGTPQRVAPAPAEVTAKVAVQSIDPASLVGAWKASRADGSTFDLNLTNTATFTWSFAQKGQAAQTFGGTYTVEGDVLALQRKDGGAMIAEIKPGGADKFSFKMMGAPAEDPGLDFQK